MEVTNMNQYVTGAVIKRLREEKNMTQQHYISFIAAVSADRIQMVNNNTSSYVPKDEWMVIENCHEPIITQELFDMAHANSKNVFV